MAKDKNFVNPLLAASSSDGATVISVKANPTNHGLKVLDGATGSDLGPTNALHSGNDIPTLVATSSADGKTPVVVYADANGNLLIKST